MSTLMPRVLVPNHRQGRVTPLVALQAQVCREARTSRPVALLMPWVTDRRNLEAAWDRVRSADGAATPGPDGQTCEEVRRQGPGWLTRLADDLVRQRFRPLPPRWIEIPKPNKPGQTRRLGLLAVRDRVVLTALKQILEPVLEPTFLSTSFGFRPGRSVPAALGEAIRHLSHPSGTTAPFTCGVHLDVADCFDTIDHRLLAAELNRHVSDPGLLRLIELFLQAGGSVEGRLLWRRARGLVQGSSLSPLLCNLALHPLDMALRELAAANQEGLCALRYADDLLILSRDPRLAERGVASTRKVLSRLQQKLREPRACPVPLTEGLEWLGVRLQARQQRWGGQAAYGYVVPDAKVEEMLARLSEMTEPPSDRIDASAFNLGRWIVSINEQLRDWRQAYLFADNAGEVFRALDDHSRERVGELLQSVTGLRRVAVCQQYRVRLPRGFWTWEVPGARLVVLSSLAPHCPGNLVRRPPWDGLSHAAVEQGPPPAQRLALPAPRLPATSRESDPAVPSTNGSAGPTGEENTGEA